MPKWLRSFVVTSYRCLVESRPVVQGIFLIRFLAGASFAGPVYVTNLTLWAGAASCTCATLSIYILNGVMDVEEDRLNNSARPMARGKLTVAQAAGAAAALGVLGFAGGLALGAQLARDIAAALGLGWLYSGPPVYLKRWPLGLGVVAILGALLIYHAGYASNGGGSDVLPLAVFGLAMALWMGLVGQTKDLSDIEGDRQAGRRSVPVVWGEDVARRVFSAVALCVGTAYVVAAAFLVPNLLVSAATVMLGALAVAAVALSSWSKGDRARRRRPYRTFMLTQYGANLTVILW